MLASAVVGIIVSVLEPFGAGIIFLILAHPAYEM